MQHAVHCKLYRRNGCVFRHHTTYSGLQQNPQDGVPELKKDLKSLVKKSRKPLIPPVGGKSLGSLTTCIS